MERPKIGVVPLYDEKRESYWMLPGYMKAVEEAGGLPFMLPLTADEGHIAQIARLFDGFLFTGGHDINPELYGEEKEALCGEICHERDAMETALFRRVLELDKPAFGICRGLQFFNVALGGTLYQDLPTQFAPGVKLNHRQSPPYAEPVHSVRIEPGTPLRRILEEDVLPVNSYHHQGIKRLAEPLAAAARAEDGLIEAAFLPDRKFVLAVQWHPEFSYTADRRQLQLFEAFVRACAP
jgi:putative glutamine amidotransferase